MKSALLICVPTSPSVSTQPLTLCPPPEKRALAELRCIALLWCQCDKHETKSTWMQAPSSPVTAGWSPVTVRLLACCAPWAWHCPFQALAMCAPSPNQIEMAPSTWKNPPKCKTPQVDRAHSWCRMFWSPSCCEKSMKCFFPPSFGHRLMEHWCIYPLLLWLSGSDNPSYQLQNMDVQYLPVDRMGSCQTSVPVCSSVNPLSVSYKLTAFVFGYGYAHVSGL